MRKLFKPRNSFQRPIARSPISRPLNGFTLVEMVVVMGIIMVLAGILLPVILRANTKAVRAQTEAELVAIATALDAYKGDFGSYPATKTGGAGTGNGFAVLAAALLGPGDATDTTPAFSSSAYYSKGEVANYSGADYVFARNYTKPVISGAPNISGDGWSPVPYTDGADGFGFRVRTGGYGRIWGPYLKPDSFKSVDVYGNKICALLDPGGVPILYFPAQTPTPNISLANTYVGDTRATPPQHPLYDIADNFSMIRDGDTYAVDALSELLGDYNEDGGIDTTSFGGTTIVETAATTAPYLLWSAGPDRAFFGIGGQVASKYPLTGSASGIAQILANKASVAASDDVTNFSFGQ